MNPKRSHEPIVWSLFGGGGVVAAFCLPALILVVGILYPLGVIDADALSYQRIITFSSHWFGKICWLTLIALPLWHAMHRIYHGLHDFKIEGGKLLLVVCYGFAFVGSVATAALLFLL